MLRFVYAIYIFFAKFKFNFQTDDTLSENCIGTSKVTSIKRSKSFKDKLDPLLCKFLTFYVTFKLKLPLQPGHV